MPTRSYHAILPEGPAKFPASTNYSITLLPAALQDQVKISQAVQEWLSQHGSGLDFLAAAPTREDPDMMMVVQAASLAVDIGQDFATVCLPPAEQQTYR
jgi:hypothetical protein